MSKAAMARIMGCDPRTVKRYLEGYEPKKKRKILKESKLDKFKERFIDERTGIEYKLVGDYYLPNIVVAKTRRAGNIGKYGRLRLKYLEEQHKAECILMNVNNELKSHLLDIEDECKDRVEQLVKEMVEKENVTEELKAIIKWNGFLK